MAVFYSVLSWGAPVGLALFFFFSGIGVGIFFWGLSHLIKVNTKQKDMEG